MMPFTRLRALMLAPSSAIFAVLFMMPLGYFFVLSFWRVRAYRLRPDATITQYLAVFRDYSKPMVFTFILAFTIAVVTTLVAFGYSYFCRFKAGRHGTLFVFVAVLTLFGGYLAKIYMWKIILGSSGILNTALIWLGIIDKPITVFLFSPIAVLITLVHYTLPLAILPIYGALRGVEDTPLQAARDLGAHPTRVLFDIVMPQIRLGMISSFSMTFIFCAGDYVTPLLLGGPHTSMIGIFIQSQFGLRVNAPLGAAMSFSVIALCLMLIAVVGLAVIRIFRARP